MGTGTEEADHEDRVRAAPAKYPFAPVGAPRDWLGGPSAHLLGYVLVPLKGLMPATGIRRNVQASLS
jgi:hypothetical protein